MLCCVNVLEVRQFVFAEFAPGSVCETVHVYMRVPGVVGVVDCENWIVVAVNGKEYVVAAVTERFEFRTGRGESFVGRGEGTACLGAGEARQAVVVAAPESDVEVTVRIEHLDGFAIDVDEVVVIVRRRCSAARDVVVMDLVVRGTVFTCNHEAVSAVVERHIDFAVLLVGVVNWAKGIAPSGTGVILHAGELCCRVNRSNPDDGRIVRLRIDFGLQRGVSLGVVYFLIDFLP